MASITEYDMTTHYLETNEAKDGIRTIAESFQIIIGALMISYSLFVFTCFTLSKRSPMRYLHKRISLSMLVFLAFSIYHGFVYSIIPTIMRDHREVLSDQACLFTTLIVKHSEIWFIFLLTLIAVEKSLVVIFPMMKRSKRGNVVVMLFIVCTIAATLFAWVPMIPGVTPPARSYRAGNHAMKGRVAEFWRMTSCNGKLNPGNQLTPIIRLVLQVLCAILIMVIAITTSLICKLHLRQQSHLTKKKELKIKKAAKNVIIVAVIIVLLMLPYGVCEMVRKDCIVLFSGTAKQNSCSAVTLLLRFVTQVLFHTACLVTIAAYTLTDREIRRDMIFYLTCGKYGDLPETQKEPETSTDTVVQTTEIRLEYLPHSVV